MTETTELTPPQRQRPELSDVVGTAILGCVGLFAMIMGLGYGVTVEEGQVGPGFLPTVTGAFVVVASIVEIARLFVARPGVTDGRVMAAVENVEVEAAEVVGDHLDGAVDTFGRTEKQRNRAPFLIFATLAVALALVGLIGLLLSFSLAMLFLLIVIERRRIWVAVVATVAAAAFVYLVFGLMLSVPLPTGLLGLI